MKSINPISSPKKTIRNITLIALAAVFLIYIVLNIVFWKRGMPERFFEYEITENSSVEIRYCSAPFFLLNVPDTIEGKPVTSIGGLFGNSFLDGGKYNYMKHYVMAVRLPDTVEKIHYGAFRDCKNLRSINIPACLKYASSHILAGTKVKEIVFPEGITEIGCGNDIDFGGYGQCVESFAGMKYLRKVVFPESLKKIGNNAFSDCTALKKITLPDGIEEIKYGAFQNSGLTEANIPKSLVNISGCIFKGTPFEETLEKEASGDFIIFNDVLLYKYIGDDENVVIPDGIEIICDRAFWTAPNVKTVEIPERVKFINSAFEYSTVESLVIPDTIDSENDLSFYCCNNLKKIVLPDNMTKIGDCAFEYCSSLETINIPDNVKTIGYSAFGACRSLKSITIPESVEEICDNAFSNCISLKEVIINGSPRIDETAFGNCTALENKPKQ